MKKAKIMAKKFIIAMEGFQDFEKTKIIETLKVRVPNHAWFNWFNGMILFVDGAGVLDATSLRDIVKSHIFDNRRLLVLEVSPKMWAGIATGDTDKVMFDWLKNVWQ